MKYALLFLKGLAMGAADVVPGVSGGTIAFITGIYEELIESINRINIEAFNKLRKEGIASAWNYINGWFFVPLFLGIGVSILSLAKGISWLLKNEPVLLWSFFFGLVFASIFFVAKQVKNWTTSPIVTFILGAAIAYTITILPASGSNDALWYIFLSGSIAICAMILPGISGSFILVLLGSYSVVLGAIHERELSIIAVFGVGAVIGLLSFARLLKTMFAKYHDVTVALLSGFLLGSLNKIWPWKQVEEVMIKHPGEVNEEIVPILERTVLPNDFSAPILEGAVVIGQESADPQLWPAIGLAVAGAALIFLMERFAAPKTKSA
jgi:putative membrane protein